jgi:hypothetical protein
MYVSYFLSIPILLLFLWGWSELLPELGWEWRVLLSGLTLVPGAPLLFRYARVIWIHFERAVNPGIGGDES